MDRYKYPRTLKFLSNPPKKSARSLNQSRVSDDSLLPSRDITFAEIGRRFSHTGLGNNSPETNVVRKVGIKMLNARITTGVMTLFTIYALFGDDLRTAAFPQRADDYFYSLTTVCCAVFFLEICVCFWLKPEFRFSFDFFMDVLSTCSLIPNIGWLWDGIMDTNGAGSGSSIGQIQNAGVSSRAGARATKIIRITRLIRIVRLVKLYKHARRMSLSREESQRVSVPVESRIGRKLSELTTRRVIVIVLVLLVTLPPMDLTFLMSPPTSWDYSGKLLEKFMDLDDLNGLMDTFVTYHESDRRPLILFSLHQDTSTVIWQSNVNPSDLRLTEKFYISTPHFVAIFDLRNDTRLASELSIAQTLFICIVFALGSLYLAKDSNDLVIIPIEKMMAKVKRIAKNPLAEQQNKVIDVYDAEEKEKKCCWDTKENRDLETAVLENTIMKIVALLAVGFGEAGAGIIASNLKNGEEFDLMLPGKKTKAIFGFCTIRNFTDTAEVLEESVLVYVNEIAEIVHHIVDSHLGAVNKNIGNAFLLVWKIEHSCEPAYLENLADLALMSFLKILANIIRSSKLRKYRAHVGLLRRMPNFSVKLGCGLHVGWAIEGSIGSGMKIDASYLSQHVSLVSLLEETTNLYGVPLLFSDSFFDILSSDSRARCRRLDSVRIKRMRVKLYTYDIDFSLIDLKKRVRYSKEKSKAKRKWLTKRMQESDFAAAELFQKSKVLLQLRALVDPGFLRKFKEGVTAYECGDWKLSKRILTEGLRGYPLDQPSHVLLNFMSSYDFLPPASWEGYRQLPNSM